MQRSLLLFIYTCVARKLSSPNFLGPRMQDRDSHKLGIEEATVTNEPVYKQRIARPTGKLIKPENTALKGI